MNIIKAIEHPQLFRSYVAGSPDGSLDSWGNWLSFLRCLYGQKTSKREAALIKQSTGRDPKKLSKDGYEECLILAGRRSGKSKLCGLIGAAEAILSGKEKKVSAGEIPLVAIISPTRYQSRIIHEYLRGVFYSSPLLEAELEEEAKQSFRLRNGVEVSIITGSPQHARGYTLIACILDEAAFFGLSEESSVKGDTEIVRAVRPALATTGGRLIAVGTPYAPKGWVYSTFKANYGNNESDVLVWNAPSLVMNPTLKQSFVDRAIEEDPVAARVEYCVEPGLFREDVEAFISREEVEALVIKGRKELAPELGVQYAAFADVSGGRHDAAALAIAHRVGDRHIVVDCIESYEAPHVPYHVVAEMAATCRRYGIEEVVGDAYAAEWTRQAFRENGIQYERCTQSVWNEGRAQFNRVVKPKSQLYAELLPRLHSGEIELLENDTLVSQLSSLQRRTRSGGRDQIDHAPNCHDDVANAFAGVVDAAMELQGFVGVIRLDEPMGNDRGSRGLQEFHDEKRRRQDCERELAQMPDDDDRVIQSVLMAGCSMMGASSARFDGSGFTFGVRRR